eukprot:3916276-Prymnesium_polylepis.1
MRGLTPRVPRAGCLPLDIFYWKIYLSLFTTIDKHPAHGTRGSARIVEALGNGMNSGAAREVPWSTWSAA